MHRKNRPQAARIIRSAWRDALRDQRVRAARHLIAGRGAVVEDSILAFGMGHASLSAPRDHHGIARRFSVIVRDGQDHVVGAERPA